MYYIYICSFNVCTHTHIDSYIYIYIYLHICIQYIFYVQFILYVHVCISLEFLILAQTDAYAMPTTFLMGVV